MSTKQAYEQKLEAQLKQWRADLDKLEAKADEAQADAKIEYQRQISSLKSKRSDLKQRLETLKKSSGDAWEEIKTGTESAWQSLSQSFKSAASKF